jgi:hypothetical protein
MLVCGGAVNGVNGGGLVSVSVSVSVSTVLLLTDAAPAIGGGGGVDDAIGAGVKH